MVPSRPVDNLIRTVPSCAENTSRCTLPSRPVEEVSPYRLVPSTKPAPTVPPRLRNLPLPSSPAVKTCPYPQIPRSKPVLTTPLRHLLPSLFPVNMPWPLTLLCIVTIVIVRITNTQFICPSTNVRRRQFRPVAESESISCFYLPFIDVYTYTDNKLQIYTHWYCTYDIVWWYDTTYNYNLYLVTCNPAALVPRSVCFTLRSPVQWKTMRTVTSRRGRNYVSSGPVVKPFMRRPVPSSKKNIPSRPVVTVPIFRPVPSRRHNFYLPSRPVMKWKRHCAVPSVPSRKLTPTVLSRPIQETIFSIFFPSRLVPFSFFFSRNMSK